MIREVDQGKNGIRKNGVDKLSVKLEVSISSLHGAVLRPVETLSDRPNLDHEGRLHTTMLFVMCSILRHYFLISFFPHARSSCPLNSPCGIGFVCIPSLVKSSLISIKTFLRTLVILRYIYHMEKRVMSAVAANLSCQLVHSGVKLYGIHQI
jgi:hypothetical protein